MKPALFAVTLSVFGAPAFAQVDPTESVVLNLQSENRSVWIRTVADGDNRLFRALPGARLIEFSDGTANLSMETVNVVDESMRLTFDIDLGGYVAPGATPPAGAPSLSPVAVNGGIDSSQWHYYTTLVGTLTGGGSLDGFYADVSRRGGPLQVGDGANLVDLSLGVSSWFNLSNVVQGPGQQLHLEGLHGDFNFSLGAATASQCVENVSNNGRVIWLNLDTNANGSGCVAASREWPVLEGSSMTEYPDGTARMLIAAVNANDPDLRLSFDVTLSGYMPPGGSAPGGSPRVTQAVTGSGIDTSTWHYYTALQGTIRGRADLEGFEATISRRGEAFQVGQGANLKDLSYGFASWFDIQVVNQNPNAQLCFQQAHGDFNGSLGSSCVCIGGKPASWDNYGSGVAGCAGVPSYTLGDDPLTGRPLVLLLGNENPMPVVATALFSDTANDMFIGVLGGTILVGLPSIASSNYIIPPGGLQVTCSVPATPCAVGLQVYTQLVCVEPCAPSGFSFSRGLHLCVGDM